VQPLITGRCGGGRGEGKGTRTETETETERERETETETERSEFRNNETMKSERSVQEQGQKQSAIRKG
jgi:hypothetical protein